jgi:hypothetical protein
MAVKKLTLVSSYRLDALDWQQQIAHTAPSYRILLDVYQTVLIASRNGVAVRFSDMSENGRFCYLEIAKRNN